MAKKRNKAAQDNAGLNVDGMGLLGNQNAVQQSPVPGLPGIGNAPTHLGPMSSQFPYAGAASLGSAAAGNGEGPQNPYVSSANIGGAGLEDVQASINQLNQSNQMAFPAVNKYAAQDNSKDQLSSTGEDNGVSFTTRDEDHATGPAAWESLGKFMKTGESLASSVDPKDLMKALAVLGVLGGTGGATFGGIFNSLQGKSIGRGMLTGGLTGAGAGMGAGAGSLGGILGTEAAINTGLINPNLTGTAGILGGNVLAAGGGTGVGGYAGYQLAQKLMGLDEEDEKQGHEKVAQRALTKYLKPTAAVAGGLGVLGGGAYMLRGPGGPPPVVNTLGNPGRSDVRSRSQNDLLSYILTGDEQFRTPAVKEIFPHKVYSPSTDVSGDHATDEEFFARTGHRRDSIDDQRRADKGYAVDSLDPKSDGVPATPLHTDQARQETLKQDAEATGLTAKDDKGDWLGDHWPQLAVGAGALGLGGYGLYKYLNRDKDDEHAEEEEDEDSYVDETKEAMSKYAKQPADQTPRHHCHGVHPDQTHEEWKASLEKAALSKYAQTPRHDCNAVHPDATHEDWVREEFDNPPTRDWEREKEKQAQSSYHRRYPKHDWSQYKGLKDIMSPYQGWNSVWEGLKPSNWAPGSMTRRTDAAVKDYLLGKNKQYPLSKDRRWSYNRPGLKLYEGTAPKELGPPTPAPKKVPTGKASTYAVPSPSDRVPKDLLDEAAAFFGGKSDVSAHQPRRPFATGKPGGSDGWWSGAYDIAHTHIPQDAIKLLKEAGYAPFPCAFFGGLINSGLAGELLPNALEKAAGLVGDEFVAELRAVNISQMLEKVGQRILTKIQRPVSGAAQAAARSGGKVNLSGLIPEPPVKAIHTIPQPPPLLTAKDLALSGRTPTKATTGGQPAIIGDQKQLPPHLRRSEVTPAVTPVPPVEIPKSLVGPDGKPIGGSTSATPEPTTGLVGPDGRTPIGDAPAYPPPKRIPRQAPVVEPEFPPRVGTGARGDATEATATRATEATPTPEATATRATEATPTPEATPEAGATARATEATPTPEPTTGLVGPDGKPLSSSTDATPDARAVDDTLVPPVDPAAVPQPGGTTRKVLGTAATAGGGYYVYDKIRGNDATVQSIVDATGIPQVTVEQLQDPNSFVSKMVAAGAEGPEAVMKYLIESQDPDKIKGMMLEHVGGAGGFDLLGGMGESINKFTEAIGMDALLGMVMGPEAVANMSPLLKLLMIAGGALGVGGAISGNTTAGMAGLAMFILPMVFGTLFGGAEKAKENAPGAGEGAAAPKLNWKGVDPGARSGNDTDSATGLTYYQKAERDRITAGDTGMSPREIVDAYFKQQAAIRKKRNTTGPDAGPDAPDPNSVGPAQPAAPAAPKQPAAPAEKAKPKRVPTPTGDSGPPIPALP